MISYANKKAGIWAYSENIYRPRKTDRWINLNRHSGRHTQTGTDRPVLDTIQAQMGFKRTLFIRTKHNLYIFGVIPFIKLQNHT